MHITQQPKPPEVGVQISRLCLTSYASGPTAGRAFGHASRKAFQRRKRLGLNPVRRRANKCPPVTPSNRSFGSDVGSLLDAGLPRRQTTGFFHSRRTKMSHGYD